MMGMRKCHFGACGRMYDDQDPDGDDLFCSPECRANEQEEYEFSRRPVEDPS